MAKFKLIVKGHDTGIVLKGKKEDLMEQITDLNYIAKLGIAMDFLFEPFKLKKIKKKS